MSEEYPDTEFFLVCIQSECGKIWTSNNSVFGYFSHSDCFLDRFLFPRVQLHLWFLDVEGGWDGGEKTEKRPKTRDVVGRWKTRTCLRNSHWVKSIQIRSFLLSVISRIRTEYKKIGTRENSVFGHFSNSTQFNIAPSNKATQNMVLCKTK